MGKKVATIILAAMFAAAVFGCNHYSAFNCKQESELDKNWGRSYETAKYNQTLYPDAGRTTEPVTGLDGNIADRVMTDHRAGKKPKEATQLKGFEMGEVGN